MVFSSPGVFGVDTDAVSVKEGDSVTLYTGVQTNQQEKIKWYFNGTRIAQITVDQSKICTDVQCNEGTERFRDRLKLDHQTGSLTITNITNTHSGLYQLQIIGSNTVSGKIFSVTVHGESFNKCLKTCIITMRLHQILSELFILFACTVMFQTFVDVLFYKVNNTHLCENWNFEEVLFIFKNLSF